MQLLHFILVDAFAAASIMHDVLLKALMLRRDLVDENYFLIFMFGNLYTLQCFLTVFIFSFSFCLSPCYVSLREFYNLYIEIFYIFNVSVKKGILFHALSKC